MTFNIIGTGNIAWFFGKRLMSGGHSCTGVFGRNTDAAKELAEALLSDVHGSISDVKDRDADICFLAVSDIAIGKVAAQLSFKQTVLVHTAGSVVIEHIKVASKDCAVLWPVYSILRSNLPAHRNIPCAWEASSPKAERYVQSIGHAITDVLFEAKGEQRKWLHLAAVMSNNFMNHLMGICEKICAENQLPFSVMYPIIEQTFDKIKNSSPQSIQTGPAVRRDSTTIQDHLALLSSHRNWQKIYEAITDSIQSTHIMK
jgi:predicted short-subunit dehydrogenase-like oxidoreductase (DUF2520 family)